MEKEESSLKNIRLNSLSNFVMLNHISFDKFKCPICGKVHDINDCVLIRQNVDKELIGRDSQTVMLKTFHVKYYNVKYYNIRICKSCDKSRKKTDKIIFGLLFCAFIVLIVNRFMTVPNYGLFGIIAGLLFFFLISGLVFWIVDACRKIDIKIAQKNNAIDTNSF